MENKLKINWFLVLIFSGFWALCAAQYPSLPELLPSHWNFKGEVDAYSNKAVVALVMPLLPLGIYLMMSILPALDPKRQNYTKFASSYETIKIGISLLMMFITTLPLLWGLGYAIDISLIMRIVLPLFFIFLGNFMGKIKFNYFLGIRTPWTLSNQQVWNKTHRFGGRAMVLGGLLALGGLALEPAAGFIVTMAGILSPLLIASAYSYFVYRKEMQNI